MSFPDSYILEGTSENLAGGDLVPTLVLDKYIDVFVPIILDK